MSSEMQNLRKNTVLQYCYHTQFYIMPVLQEARNLRLEDCVRNLFEKVKSLWKLDMQNHHLQEQDRYRIGALMGWLIEIQGESVSLSEALLEEESPKKCSLRYLALALEGFEDAAQETLESIPIGAVRTDLELQATTLGRLFEETCTDAKSG